MSTALLRKMLPMARQLDLPRSASGSRGNLKIEHVPGTQQLPPGAEGAPKQNGVRYVHNHQTVEWAHLVYGEEPGDRRPPIMPEQDRRPRAGGVDQTGDVVEQVSNRIILPPRRTICFTVAAQIDCPCPVTKSREQRQLIPPRVPTFPETRAGARPTYRSHRTRPREIASRWRGQTDAQSPPTRSSIAHPIRSSGARTSADAIV